MQQINFPVTRMRSLYLRVTDIMKKTGLGSYIATPFLIRMENVITTRTQYSFDFYQNTAGDRPTEVKLNRNDAFFFADLGLGLYSEAASGSNRQQIVYTWPNPAVFAAAGPPTEAAELEQLYNSLLTVKTSPVERLSNLHTSVFKYDPGREAGTAEVGVGNSYWGPSLQQHGLLPIEPGIIVDGYQDNSIIIDTGDSDFTTVAGEGDDVLVVYCYGFKVENGAGRLGQFYFK